MIRQLTVAEGRRDAPREGRCDPGASRIAPLRAARLSSDGKGGINKRHILRGSTHQASPLFAPKLTSKCAAVTLHLDHLDCETRAVRLRCFCHLVQKKGDILSLGMRNREPLVAMDTAPFTPAWTRVVALRARNKEI